MEVTFYYDRDTGEEVKGDAFEEFVEIHGIDKASDCYEVVTIHLCPISPIGKDYTPQ